SQRWPARPMGCRRTSGCRSRPRSTSSTKAARASPARWPSCAEHTSNPTDSCPSYAHLQSHPQDSLSRAGRAARARRDARHPRCPYKDGPGEINVPICVGGMVVNPGDIVVGDQDGLLAIPQEGVAALIDKARAVLDAEAETMRAMREGRWNRAFIDVLEARCNN